MPEKTKSDEQKKPELKNQPREKEVGGRQGPEPTRYGDWESNGLASDF